MIAPLGNGLHSNGNPTTADWAGTLSIIVRRMRSSISTTRPARNGGRGQRRTDRANHSPRLCVQFCDDVGDQAAPASLMRGAQTTTALAVEILVEQDVVLEMRIRLELLVIAEDRTPAA
jgi:hypothetical protein